MCSDPSIQNDRRALAAEVADRVPSGGAHGVRRAVADVPRRSTDRGSRSGHRNREPSHRVRRAADPRAPWCAGLTLRVLALVGVVVAFSAWEGSPRAQHEPRSARRGTNRAPRDIDEAVRRFHDPRGSVDHCAPQPPVDGESRWRCHATECPGACRVVERVTVIGERNGRYRRVSQERIPRGDTGACGCCISSPF